MTSGVISEHLLAEWQGFNDKLGTPVDVRATMDDALDTLGRHHARTAEHCVRVGIKGAQIAEYLGMDPRPPFYGGTLHDYGKLYVSRELLSKITTWTEEDALALRNHPIDGYKKVMEAGLPVIAGIVVRHHTFQTNAYPEHSPELPSTFAHLGNFVVQNARIVALADYYDAAHRNDSTDNFSGEQIRVKVRMHNPDLVDEIDGLYEAGVFSVD